MATTATFSHQGIDLPLGIADKIAMLSWTRKCIRSSPMQIGACGLLLAFVAHASAQEAATISNDVKVVSVLATVHDREGRVVKDLNQDDFTLLEDGVPQKIRYFSRETGLPLTIGLLVDTSRSQTGVLEQERGASYKFLDHILGENGDTAFIAHFDTSVGILQSLMSSRQDLASTLRQLRIPVQYATLIFSAIRQCSDQVIRKQPVRAAVVAAASGPVAHGQGDRRGLVRSAERPNRRDLRANRRGASQPIRYRIHAGTEYNGGARQW